MTEAAKKWMQKNKPRPSKSKMAAYKADLLALYSEGYTLSQMQEFLGSCDVKATVSEIWGFIKKQAPKVEIQSRQKQAPTPQNEVVDKQDRYAKVFDKLKPRGTQ